MPMIGDTDMSLLRRRTTTVSAFATVFCSALLLAGGGASTAASAADARAVSSGGTWGTAIEAPGSGALNTGGSASIASVSCSSAGNCGAGGFISIGSQREAIVITQKDGHWGKEQLVPGIEALNITGNSTVGSVSCASAGNCGAGGFYWDESSTIQAFVVTEKNGHWDKAEEVPGLAALSAGQGASTASVSCPAAGDCVAAGGYQVNLTDEQAFVVSDVRGVWGKAKGVPGLAALNTGEEASVASVSCDSPGNCSAGGDYSTASGAQAFVVNEVNGKWRAAQEVAGTAALNVRGYAGINAVSCASAGNCAAGGYVETASATEAIEAIVVDETHGKWGRAKVVRGYLTTEPPVTTISCASPGNCAAGGGPGPFVVSEVHGKWQYAIPVPGWNHLGGYQTAVNSVSCASPGNCAAGGYYKNAYGEQAFVANEVNGTWRNAMEVPGTETLNADGGAAIQSVSCASAGNCSAGGSYEDSSGHYQALVVTEKTGGGL
jgi:hypothetical protein